MSEFLRRLFESAVKPEVNPYLRALIPDSMPERQPMQPMDVAGMASPQVGMGMAVAQAFQQPLPQSPGEWWDRVQQQGQAMLDPMNVPPMLMGMPVPMSPQLSRAVAMTRGAELHPAGDYIRLKMERQQLPEQAGMPSVRGATFFLPEEGGPFRKHYTTGRTGYGGPQRVVLDAEFNNPIVVKAGTGGTGPARAFDQIKGRGAYQEMRRDVLDAITQSIYARGPDHAKVLEQKVAHVLETHGGNPSMARYIIENSKGGNRLAYAVQEHIVASQLRAKGYDAVISYTKTKAGERLSEVFDLTREKYPTVSTAPAGSGQGAGFFKPQVWREFKQNGYGWYSVLHKDTNGKFRVTRFRGDSPYEHVVFDTEQEARKFASSLGAKRTTPKELDAAVIRNSKR